MPETRESSNMVVVAPQIVSIGPNHYGNRQLQSLQRRKPHYLMLFLQNCLLGRMQVVDVFRRMIPRIQSFYSVDGTAQMKNNDDLIEMLLLDGSLILMFMLDRVQEEEKATLHKAKSDMLLPHNQLPFFVLEDLFNLLKEKPADCSLVKLAINLFADFLLLAAGEISELLLLSSPGTKFIHLHHLFHSCAEIVRQQTTPIIPKIREIVRSTYPSAYDPAAVSLGPYHCHQQLEITVVDKQNYVKRICNVRNLNIREYRQSLSSLMPQIRNYYYSKRSAFDGVEEAEVLEMLLRDSCFVMELMLGKQASAGPYNDPILHDKEILALIKSDMLLLENQLPFIILETLFNLLSPKPYSSLIQLVIDFFTNFLPSGCSEQWLSGSKRNFYHLLHLYHSCATAPPPAKKSIEIVTCEQSATKFQLMLIPRAGDLVEGTSVKFKRLYDGSFFTMSFRQGVMKLSPVRLNNIINSLFRNLIAFEQHIDAMGKAPVSAYMMTLGCLIGSEKDLEVLRRQGIVYAPPAFKATEFFSATTNDTILDYDSTFLANLKDFSMEVRSYNNNSICRWMTKVRQNCTLSNIGTFVSAVVGVFILSVPQTIFATLGYFNPHN